MVGVSGHETGSSTKNLNALLIENSVDGIWIADTDVGTDVQMTLPVTEKTVER
jgi:hypothetical protein